MVLNIILHFVLSGASSSFNITLSISLLHKSFQMVFCLPLHLFLVHLTFFLAPSSSVVLLSCPYHFTFFSVIFFVTGATSTDALTCSFPVVSVFVSPHIHRSILISFTSSLFSWLFVVDHVSVQLSVKYTYYLNTTIYDW